MTGPRFSLSAGFSPWQSIQTRSFCKQKSSQLGSIIYFHSLIKRKSDSKRFWSFTYIFLPVLIIVLLDVLHDILGDVIWQILSVKDLRLPSNDFVELQQDAGAALLESIIVFPGAVSLMKCADQWKIVTSKDNKLYPEQLWGLHFANTLFSRLIDGKLATVFLGNLSSPVSVILIVLTKFDFNTLEIQTKSGTLNSFSTVVSYSRSD